MYIDSLSLTWYLVGAESKILNLDKTLKPVSAYNRETICPMACARARAGKSVGLFRQRNKRYGLHRRICRRCAYEACQGEDLSRWIGSYIILLQTRTNPRILNRRIDGV